eukprot:TRINITY_DN20429_c0_g2_i1.p1 TRINITY_DN20429_c0_g2~~TRINITY_DN20429_c0_g2_i1.p1  ORF type:complete len:376 (-),score=67.33 TRINITY_DN20429_c0_g2_i1:38-1108(-)
MASAAFNSLPDDVEVHLARTQLLKDGKGLVPALVVLTAFSAQQLYTGGSDLCYASLTLTAGAWGGAFFMLRLAKVDDSRIVASAKFAEKILMAVRVLMHAFCACYDDGSASAMYYRIVSLFCLPLTAARSCRDRRNFISFLMAHNCIVALRFWRSYADDMPWIVGTLAVQMLLMDILTQLHDQHSMRAQLSDALDNVKRVSESSVRASFDVFCDTTVQLDKSFRCQQTESLAEFLDTPTVGDVCHFPGLLDDAREMVELSKKLDELADQVTAHAKSTSSSSLTIEPLQFRFRGRSTSDPVTLFPVGVLDCKGEVSFLIGICSGWKQSLVLAGGEHPKSDQVQGARRAMENTRKRQG